MLGEPWCFTPAQIAELTPWQVEHCYLAPARERSKRLSGEREIGEGGHDWKTLPPKAEFVAEYTNAFGLSAEHWAGVWERMRAKRLEDGDE